MRYKGYCANVGRTFIVDPDKVRCFGFVYIGGLPHRSLQEQESIYNLLLTLQAELLTKMKDGAFARDIYQHAASFIKKQKPELEKNFVKNIGFGVSDMLSIVLYRLTGGVDGAGVPRFYIPSLVQERTSTEDQHDP